MFKPGQRAAFFEKLKKSGRLNPATDQVQMPKVHILKQAPNPMASYDKLDEQDPSTILKPPETGIHFKRLKKLWA